MGLVEGQPTAGGPEGQVASVGAEGQSPNQPTNDGVQVYSKESQQADRDTSEGQENDARPYDERRPYPNNVPNVGPGANSVQQGPVPSSGRSIGGSSKRVSTVAFKQGVTSPGARGEYNA